MTMATLGVDMVVACWVAGVIEDGTVEAAMGAAGWGFEDEADSPFIAFSEDPFWLGVVFRLLSALSLKLFFWLLLGKHILTDRLLMAGWRRRDELVMTAFYISLLPG
jgi:hypothetical protein